MTYIAGVPGGTKRYQKQVLVCPYYKINMSQDMYCGAPAPGHEAWGIRWEIRDVTEMPVSESRTGALEKTFQLLFSQETPFNSCCALPSPDLDQSFLP